jgi:CRISPR/Cas system CMR subunit Cmr6 (Cas7 group RAMP superfamily)
MIGRNATETNKQTIAIQTASNAHTKSAPSMTGGAQTSTSEGVGAQATLGYGIVDVVGLLGVVTAL